MLTLAVLLTNVIFIQPFAQVSTENDTTAFSNASPLIKKPYVIVISADGMIMQKNITLKTFK